MNNYHHMQGKHLFFSYAYVIIKLQNNKSRLDKTTAVISASNPLAVLKRGYSAVTADGKRISTVSQLAVGQKISVAFCDGVATATVNSLEEK